MRPRRYRRHSTAFKLELVRAYLNGEGGYKTMGAGKLFHHPAGAVDLRGWDEFYVRSKAQRESGYPMNSWSEEVPFPDPFPNSIYNRGQEITGGHTILRFYI